MDKPMYPLWNELQQWKVNNFQPKKVAKKMIKEATKWLPYPLEWQGGSCIANTPYGDYIWFFAIEMEQEKVWNLPEFQAGRAFGHKPEIPFRDANPYPYEPARQRSWDRGYILGLSERPIQKSDQNI